jgi:hypothetical protein
MNLSRQDDRYSQVYKELDRAEYRDNRQLEALGLELEKQRQSIYLNKNLGEKTNEFLNKDI